VRRAAIAVAAAAALLGAAPAAHARTDDLAKKVLLVTGPEDASCGRFDDFSSALAEFTASVHGEQTSFAGQIETVGRGGGCTHDLGLGASATWADYAAGLADVVKQQSKTVDVVAFGGGGLMVRRALMDNPQLKVEDVVTLGTPHAGSDALAAKCGARAVCDGLKPGSAFLKALARNPQGKGGTDWSAIGSQSDDLVSADSAVAMDAEHRTIYLAPGPGHDALATDVASGDDMKIRHSHGRVDWTVSNKAPHPFVRAAKDLAFGAGDADHPCGLAATQPDQCGRTPVILVPGFGASELECTTPLGSVQAWPEALNSPALFYDMALGKDGVGPLYNRACANSMKPTGRVLQEAAGQDIHKSSWAWVQRIAQGHAYQFGWDYRKGPDESLDALDKLIDEVRAKHGVDRVAIVCHSYGGLITRWYIDTPERARKVTRVANFGSPWWGVPKPWFAMAYGYETPSYELGMDYVVPNDVFKVFTKNLTGLYYLFPSESWFLHAPKPLRTWLDVNEVPQAKLADAISSIRAFKGNGKIASDVAANHKQYIDGFTRANGVDWRIFIGSGLPTLGHVRAYTDSDDVQYSWVNGDGTVPLFSQRQSAREADHQLGDDVPTYHFCNIKHMVEMEDPSNQDAAAPFVAEGKDPVVDGTHLRDKPCPLAKEQFAYTGREDLRSLAISEDAEAAASRVRARAAQAPMTLREAEAEGLVDVIDEPRRTVFVTTTDRPLRVHLAGRGLLQVTPLTGDAKTGEARVYDVTPGGIDVSVKGALQASAAPSRAADRKAPRTTLKRRGGKLVARAKDASGVAVTLVQIGNRRPRRYTKPLRVSRRAKVRYWSVDVWGNTERKRRMR
jgi:pimeloyl-ACP methyl ester carboxylesterase